MIKVGKGQEYVFSILVETEEWVDGHVASTPETGWRSTFYNFMGSIMSYLKRSSKANWYALVGAVEASDEDSFAIFGTRHMSVKEDGLIAPSWPPVAMTKTGELYFYANDMKGRYFNNKGSLRLKIKRII